MPRAKRRHGAEAWAHIGMGVLGGLSPFLLKMIAERAGAFGDGWWIMLVAQLALGGIVAHVLPGGSHFVSFYHGLTAPAVVKMLSGPH